MAYKDKNDPRARARSARHRAKNRSRLQAYQRDYMRRKQKVRQSFIEAYKAIHPCVDCGESNPVVLDFDHRDYRTKEFNVSERISSGNLSIMALEKEIAKCDMRCANCHRKKTAAERHLRSKPKDQKISSQLTLFE